MAAYTSGHGHEMMSNSFPSLRPTPMQPELPSYWSALNMGKHSLRFADQSCKSYNDDVDAFPDFRQPVPSLSQEVPKVPILDPSLKATPEKTVAGKLKKFSTFPQGVGSDLLVGCGKERTKSLQKVRFDSTVDIKHISPSVPDTSADDLSIIDIHTDDILQDFDLESSLTSSLQEQKWDKEETEEKNYMYSSANYQDCADYDDDDEWSEDNFSETDPKTVADYSNHKISKSASNALETINSKTNPTINSSRPYAGLPCLVGQPAEHDLARPELHSTLHVRREMAHVQQSELNLNKALQKTLKMSEDVRNKIAEKASSKLNTEQRTYDDLVSVEVHKDDLLFNVEKRLAAQMKAMPRARTMKPEDSLTRVPDLMEFFTHNLQKESPNLTLQGIPTAQPKLGTAELQRAFDVYKHVHSWEGW